MCEKTKEKLLYFMSLPPYNMTAKDVAAKLAHCKCKMPFVSEEWENYIKCLTRQPSCIYCGAPKSLQVVSIGPNQTTMVCMESKTHWYMLDIEQRVQRAGRTPEQAREYMLWKCEHGILRFDCYACDEILLNQRRLG